MHFRSINYCRIFTELAETFLETIINGSMNGKEHYAIKSLDFALMCVGHHDYEVIFMNNINPSLTCIQKLIKYSCRLHRLHLTYGIDFLKFSIKETMMNSSLYLSHMLNG